MDEKDLLQLLIFIAEEDAQISTIVGYFTNELGYDINTLKNIVYYSVKMKILQVVQNDQEFESYIVVNNMDLSKIDWSTSNVRNEIHYNNFENYKNVI